MKVITAINAGRLFRNNASVTDDTIMGWLSSLDQDIALQAGENHSSADIQVTGGLGVYDMPAGFSWEDITHVWLDDLRIPKVSAAARFRPGISLVNDKLSVYPVPTVDRNLHILQQSARAAYTDKAADDLFLPAPFDKSYQYYVAGQIYFYDRDMDMYNNMVLRFNNEVEGYWRRRAKVGESDRLEVTGLW